MNATGSVKSQLKMARAQEIIFIIVKDDFFDIFHKYQIFCEINGAQILCVILLHLAIGKDVWSRTYI